MQEYHKAISKEKPRQLMTIGVETNGANGKPLINLERIKKGTYES